MSYHDLQVDTSLIVTGSARLDYYRKGGDSLLGRYHYYRLHPLSIRECDQNIVYRIAPFGTPKIRAVKKENKLYFWDWSAAADAGARFENMVAGHLLKYCHFIEDTEGYDMELRFIRDTDGREVDFMVLRESQPLFAVECKTGERNPSAACAYFRERTGIPLFYQVHLGEKDYGNEKTGTRVLPFMTFCQELNLP